MLQDGCRRAGHEPAVGLCLTGPGACPVPSAAAAAQVTGRHELAEYDSSNFGVSWVLVLFPDAWAHRGHMGLLDTEAPDGVALMAKPCFFFSFPCARDSYQAKSCRVSCMVNAYIQNLVMHPLHQHNHKSELSQLLSATEVWS